MPFIPVLGVVQAELVYTWEGQTVETVLHFEPSDPPTPALMTELGAFLVTWFNTVLKPTMPTTISLVNIKLTDLTTETAPVVNYGTGLPIAGTGASPALPNNVAFVITKRTAQRGRSFRGRIYHPGLMEGSVTGNTVSGSAATAIIGAYDDLLAFSTAGATWTMGVVSRYTNLAPRATGVFTGVVNLTTDGNVDSQRRRLPGRGA